MLRAASASLAFLFVAPALSAADEPLSFVNDVMPHLVKAGCASGNCHAKPEGQNNFKLSVMANDLQHDHHEIVFDGRGRRVSLSAPEESLLLKKALGELPHEGGKRIEAGSDAYNTLLTWIRQGVPGPVESERKLTSISVEPRLASYQKKAAQQLKVTAAFSDGSKRDVTRLAVFTSQHGDIAKVNDFGLIQVGDYSGEAVLVINYMGKVDVLRVTVPSDRKIDSFLYAKLPANNDIDRLIYERHQTLGILPSETCTDHEFLRRASLDLIGRLPSPELARSFLEDKRGDKREQLIDKLLEDPNYADYWSILWGDLIRPNPSRVGVKPVYLIDQWIRDSFRQNKPYDKMVRELLTAVGSTHEYGPVAMWRDKRDPADASAFVSRIFLGVRLDCARCHHHLTEKWTQDDYFQMAAFFGQMQRKGQGISAPISGEPEYWWNGGSASGTVKHPITEAVMTPKPPDGPEMPLAEGQDPREKLVDWMTQPENPFFAKAIVNRVWAQLMGVGIVEPVDDFRASNPPSNGPLLDALAADFVKYGYDLKQLLRTIARSRSYQLSSKPNETNRADTRNFARFQKRRLGAEVLLDAVSDVTGTAEKFDGLPTGSRAVQTWNHKLPSEFMDAFGRPNSSQECPCERDLKPSVVQALHLMNSNRLQEKLAEKTSRIHKLIASEKEVRRLIDEVYLASYSRFPDESERSAALKYFEAKGADRQTAVEDLAWALINSAEFVFNH